jgi:hypothetical protein
MHGARLHSLSIYVSLDAIGEELEECVAAGDCYCCCWDVSR